jgi:hypothetical protein
MPKRLLILLVVCCACQKTSEPEPPTGQQKEADTKAEGLAFPGLKPPELDPAELPGPQGPFVEPPLLERPRDIHHVVAGYPKDLIEARKLLERLAGLKAVPVGYPSIDQAQGLGRKGSRWVVLAGKFARPGYAKRLLEVVKQAGFDEAVVVTRRYLHDRFRPAINQADKLKVGRVFAGMAGMQVPLLTGPATSAPGTGAMIKDGALAEVSEGVETNDGIWFRVQARDLEGYLPASRLLVDYNVFPSPSGRRAVLGVSLGCQAGKCRWDYWMVGREYSPRKLLVAAAERLPHAFSPEGNVLAYASASRPMTLAFEGKDSEVSLGAGTSPSWAFGASGGNLVYFRRPGLNQMRDEVMAAVAPDWKVRKVLDFRGQPHYPKALSVIPPAVDILEGGAKLYTMFYRLVSRDGGVAIHRWKVLFNPEGNIISKKGEQITE